jgi:general stress protein 26
MSLNMTKAEREEFLAAVHVGIISIEQPGRAPLAVPIWYDYEPDVGVWVITEKDSLKGRLLERAERYSLCAQTEDPPYRYVSVEGPVSSVRRANLEKDLRPMAHRYLGQAMGDAYLASQSNGGGSVFTMQPDRWKTDDYSKM